MRVAINGMGRIGRLLGRRLIDLRGLELVAVNDIMDTDNLAYLFRYDSVYGTLPSPVLHRDGKFIVGTKEMAVFRQADPSRLPWKDLGVDVVLECSGKFSHGEGVNLHLEAGARKVLLSTTGTSDIPLLIYGFNQHLLTADSLVISPGGCMTNCSTHILYLLNSIGITSAHLNILHSYTSRQELVDAPHKQFRRGRAAAESIIPVEIDLAVSLERLMPPLQGKIAAVSTRVPVANGAMADLTVQMQRPVTAREINSLFSKAAQQEYKGILEYSEEPLVSLDIKGNTHSCLIDGTLTSVVGNHLKLVAWFDNEYGYTSRMIDWLFYWKKFL
ncbi:glyceraldehyde 3-phosphate dehydrogenase NAD-binding domain-containing protein [Flavitalea sp. BT771]|uniref:type I glyceraldehyde-3-phosphate dehydrogenase n=1 Tax=Flavitalea sp. BT771 TaxID=3063329 RepID=UPI0026E2BFAC|nr:glyceraldehyde 3-phosphate dehydrogenase NAD-binding domain-containing protein [Flavitalea sp. BT771]MDO6432481.1 glyceraldehyde 3-phosphate dehydrogenase NAD-binding domain-containing protein [Flavitalea sp. BT771]MDV6221390.1 glyceraldehyde 3-phosphate dehydrogenase NAD-binding domain-containing protein [Flavitalea sp. BT771]